MWAPCSWMSRIMSLLIGSSAGWTVAGTLHLKSVAHLQVCQASLCFALDSIQEEGARKEARQSYGRHSGFCCFAGWRDGP